MRFPELRPLVFLAATASLACAPATRTSPGGLPGDPTRTAVTGSVTGQRASANSTANASRKRVDTKEEPATLVAADRTRCTVTEQRFRDTKVGDNAVCDWRTGDRAP